MARSEVLVDTAFAIAVLNHQDQHHARAVALAREIRGRVRLVLTRAVCLEIGNALTGPRFRVLVGELLNTLESDPDVLLVPWEERVYAAAVSLFRSRPDKKWSLTDCMSFVVMRERGITDALTTDGHFRQAGFRPLLLPSAN